MENTHELEIRDKMGWQWVTLPEAINMDNYLQLERRLEAELKPVRAKVVFDLAQTKILYSSGMGLLIRQRRRIADAGGVVCLVNVSQRLRDGMAALNLERIFPIYSTDVEFEISESEVWDKKVSEDGATFMAVSQEERGVCHTVLSGYMTAVSDLSSFGTTLCEGAANSFVFDLTGLESVDSAGIALLTKVLSRIRKRGGISVAYGAREAILDMFAFVSMEQFVTFYDNEREAMEAIKVAAKAGKKR